MRGSSAIFVFAALGAPFVVSFACGGPQTQATGPTPTPAPTATSIAVTPTTSTSTSSSTTSASSASPPQNVVLGVDASAMDPSVDPCDDFYEYACGGWRKKTPIPEDRPVWSRGFSEVDERILADLHFTLEKEASQKTGDPYADKMGGFWNACMDEDAIEKSGMRPLDPAFTAIAATTDPQAPTSRSVMRIASELVKMGYSPLFNFYAGQDFADATQMIGQLEQGGLGLPDRDYYVSTKPKMIEARKIYEEHVGKMLELAGQPASGAAVVMKIETELAKVSMTRKDRRDPKKTYHKTKRAEVAKIAPGFGWTDFFDALALPKDAPVNVMQPGFLRGLDATLAKFSLDDWRTFLRWRVVHEIARALPKKFVDEDFRYTSAVVTGAKTLLPRWKRCVDATDLAMGEALGQPFVRDHFGADGKAMTQSMVGQVEEAMRHDLEQLSWMDEKTRKKALEKLSKIHNKIGYPDAWRDYSSLEVDGKSPYATNVLHASVFELHRQLAKIGKPVDRNEWQMSPPTVNAYYDSSFNEMVFPAGILQPPFWAKESPMQSNWGAIGMVMGHELTHGFDDEGRQFDGDGNMKEWWDPATAKKFETRAKCIVDQYSGFVAIDDLHVDGELTLGENIADNGGIKLAYAAFEEAKKAAPPTPAGARTPEQDFFISYAQIWCQNERAEYRRTHTATDPHSPARWRVIGPLQNFAPFAATFQCTEGKKMVKKDRCEIW